nr:BTAD domain-containing putative transcriptional regulator [Nocardia transvalensis]
MIGDAACSVEGHKLRSIVAILSARQGDTVGRDELIEELELPETTKNSTNALHAHITRLRRWLKTRQAPADLIETVGSAGYRINLDRGRIDAFRFIRAVDHAVTLAPRTPLVVSTILQDSMALWRGEALRDVVDSPTVHKLSEELSAARSLAQETLLTAWTDLGSYDRVIFNGRKFISENPLNERLWETLIDALRKTGRDAEAVASYHRLERILHEELGVRPSRRLVQTLGDSYCA